MTWEGLKPKPQRLHTNANMLDLAGPLSTRSMPLYFYLTHKSNKLDSLFPSSQNEKENHSTGEASDSIPDNRDK